MKYENLLSEYDKQLDIYELDMGIKGLYADGVVAISSKIPSTTEKACILAEELGHYHTSSGDILDQSKVNNVKQEKRARNWAFEKLVPLEKLISAYRYGCENRFQLAGYLEITEEFLDESIQHYKEKYGQFYRLERYIIYFDPLGIFQIFDENQ